jgi:hypothetical protein
VRCGTKLLLCRGRLFQVAAGLVGHEHHCSRQLGIREAGAGARRHGALALDDGLQQAVQSELEPRRPGGLVAELGRVGDAWDVAGGADLLDDLLAAFCSCSAGGAELDFAHRLDACGHGLRGQGGRIRARPVDHQLHQQHDAEDRHHERQQHDRDELLGRFDERGMLVVLGHADASRDWCW